jgi:hypothetical protein
MAHRSAENKFLFVSFLVVALLGVKTVTSLLERPVTESRVVERQPASVVKKEVVSQASANFDFNCQKEASKELTVKAPLLQIRGKGCITDIHIGQISIVNKSNGYTASVFNTGHEEFQTDLIQLVEGQNQILIQYQNASGKKFERRLLVKSSHI